MLKLSDLLAVPRLRSKPVTIEGVGVVTLHEFTAAEAWEISDAINKDSITDPLQFARWAVRALKGAGQDITDDECKALMANVGQGSITAIFSRALNFDNTGSTEIEEAAKN